ncbi:hypothetical protein FLX08_00775 [Microbispora hainanensis]|uniref:Uncharacterized protein n=1 Tax=Microbispora hainanensis TaxID=568844 RepID=A0A544Z5D4_9ACTN|nr:hypothetical protein FLX08_00775 [Microbispora hainanensis]
MSNLVGGTPRAPCPDIVVKLLARRNPQLAMLLPELGRTRLVDSRQKGPHPRARAEGVRRGRSSALGRSWWRWRRRGIDPGLGEPAKSPICPHEWAVRGVRHASYRMGCPPAADRSAGPWAVPARGRWRRSA